MTHAIARTSRSSFYLLQAALRPPALPTQNARPRSAIRGDAFHINGKPTYAGRTWQGQRIEGLLFNSRMVQGIFDDLNPETVGRWAYPDTGRWDPERNTREFLAAMPEWRRHGLLGFTINLQGGSPQGYSREQPWHNSAITPEGTLRPDYMARLEQILDRADELGMVVILGIFYFGQDQRLRDEAAVRPGGRRHGRLDLRPRLPQRADRGQQRVQRALRPRDPAAGPGPRADRARQKRSPSRPALTAGGCWSSTSYGGGTVPKENVVRAADFLLDARQRRERSRADRRDGPPVPAQCPATGRCRSCSTRTTTSTSTSRRTTCSAAVGEYASWGYFDPGKSDYADGYQCPPVHWQINTPRKKAFFRLVKEVTGE